MKPLIRRARADLDVEEAIAYYPENEPEVTLAFVDALEQAYRHIQRHPGTGSPRYAHELNLPGLRFWGCKRFPNLVFYVEKAEQIDVWRVLHAIRDIPAWMRGDDEPTEKP
jgi:toxin ParE1/3/4